MYHFQIVNNSSELAFSDTILKLLNMTNQRKHRSSPRQPLDRHLSEIGEHDGTTYINVGIDSTW